MIPLWLLPVLTTMLCAIGAGLALWTGLVDARAARKAAHAQELRDIDEWLVAMWKASP